MNRVQFLVVTIISGFIALFVLLQIFLSYKLGTRERDLSNANSAMQEGESEFQRLQQIATRVAQLSGSDDQLKQLLARNNIQIGANTNEAPANPAPAPAPAAPTH